MDRKITAILNEVYIAIDSIEAILDLERRIMLSRNSRKEIETNRKLQRAELSTPTATGLGLETVSISINKLPPFIDVKDSIQRIYIERAREDPDKAFKIVEKLMLSLEFSHDTKEIFLGKKRVDTVMV